MSWSEEIRQVTLSLRTCNPAWTGISSRYPHLGIDFQLVQVSRYQSQLEQMSANQVPCPFNFDGALDSARMCLTVYFYSLVGRRESYEDHMWARYSICRSSSEGLQQLGNAGQWSEVSIFVTHPGAASPVIASPVMGPSQNPADEFCQFSYIVIM